MYDTYIVKENDTINSISSKYNTSPEVLYQLNGYEFSIQPGMTLIVPRITSKYFDYYTVNKGDTLYKIAMDNKIDANLLAQLNGINITDYIYPNQVLLVPKAGTILYITAIGDTLKEIADGFKTSISELVKQNDKIYLQPEQLIVYKY
ncbi:MAG: LysM peptidoglycan-binding domain-containing protein [Bacilli bacterium]|nr:LysM peptidoglycan-binding domain-containing protein [Bacilli bacterium]